MSESHIVIKQVARATGESFEMARTFCNVAHETVDECVTDDVSVVAPPLVIGRLGCPVLDRLLLRLGDGRWPMPDSLDVPAAELAATLMLPVDIVETYPLVGRFGLLAKCLDRLMARDEDAERYLAMLDAWLETFEPKADDVPQTYQVWPMPGYALGGWLLARMDLLHKCGFPVRLTGEITDGVRGQGHVFSDGHRADVVLRFTEDCDYAKKDDWLVVECKTTAVGAGACDQLAMTVDWLRAEVTSGEVHGLLIADGMSLELERGLRERRFYYQSLTTLGYRRWVRLHSPVLPEPADDTTSISYPANLSIRQLAAAVR